MIRYKKNIYYLLIFILIIIISYFINDNSNRSLVRALSESAFWMSVPVFISSIVTLFLNEKVFLSWRKFTNYFLVVSVVLILYSPTSTQGFFNFSPITKEMVTIALALLYSLISIVLISYRSFNRGF